MKSNRKSFLKSKDLGNYLKFNRANKTHITKFFKYVKWRHYLEQNIGSKLASSLNLDTQRSAAQVWSAMNCQPTVIAEPVFEQLFGIKAVLPTNEEVKRHSDQLRNEAVSILISESDKPTHINVGRLFSDLDTLFGLKGKTFKPIYPQQAADALPSSTSSAFPDFKKKGEVKDKVVQQANYVLINGDYSWINFPAIVRWRTQQRKSGTKFRQFYMFGYLILILEATFVVPFFKHFEENKDTSYCFGNKFVHLAPKIKALKEKFDVIYSLDFKSFDQNVTSKLIDLAFKYIKSHLAISSRNQEIIFNMLCSYAKNCSIATRYEGVSSIVNKERGVMSGSVLTNLMDTIVNAIMLSHALRKMKQPVKKEALSIMGDDCLMGAFLNGSTLSLEQLGLFFKQYYDADLSIDKSHVYDADELNKSNGTVYFLGYDLNERGRYSDFELFKQQLLFSESFIPESVLSTPVRLFSKLASICFKCCDGYQFWDKYAPGLAKILNIPIPNTFKQIYSITGDPIDYSKEESIADYKFLGWLNQ